MTRLLFTLSGIWVTICGLFWLAVVYPWTLLILAALMVVGVSLIKERLRYQSRKQLRDNHSAIPQHDPAVIQRDIRKREERRRAQLIQGGVRYAVQLRDDAGRLIPCACEAWASMHTHTVSPNTIVTFNGKLVRPITPAGQTAQRLDSGGYHHTPGTLPGKIRRPVISELARMTPEQRAGFRTVPVNPAEMSAAQRQLFAALTQAPVKPKPPVAPCTEGGPCRAADREIVTDPRGHRVGSLCTRCDRRRAWLPFLENGK